MRDLVFFAAVYGLSISLAVLGIGGPFRAAGTWLDRKLFSKRWLKRTKPEERGGPIHRFVHCPACLAFWAALGGTGWHAPLGPAWPDRITVALAATGMTWVVHVILYKLGQYEL